MVSLFIGFALYWTWMTQCQGNPVGKPAPGFSVLSSTGEKVSLSQYKGKVVFLHFWSTTCPPCVKEIPEVEKLYQKYKGKDFVVLPIALDDTKETVAAFQKTVPFSFTVYFDSTDNAAFQYGVTGYPETFIINKKGEIVKKVVGPRQWMSAEWAGFFDGLISQ